MRTLLVLLLTLPFLTACGVTERRQIMTDRDPGQVWEAMKAVAQTPDYYARSIDVDGRWIVRQNDVAYDDNVRRMEVYRRLEREVHKPLSPVRREEREWKFEILLEVPPPPELHTQPSPPVMLFRTRNAGVPAHAWDEATWYFDEVERFLEPLPAAEPAPG
jgi:hypothetical protein